MGNRFYFLGNDLKSNFPLLSRYNEITDQFEFVRYKDSLLIEGMAISDPIQITEDTVNRLWFFGSRPGEDGVGLYSFDLIMTKPKNDSLYQWVLPTLVLLSPRMVIFGSIMDGRKIYYILTHY